MMAERRTVRDMNKDRISDLPQNIIDCILECMTTLDAARTSILSKKWRYIWSTYPQLVLDEEFFEDVIKNKQYIQYEFVRIINKILIVHSGPILEFDLYIPNIIIDQTPDIDQWILVLSRNGIKYLTLTNSNLNPYNVPSYIFSCLELELLKLTNCALKPPVAFGGFRSLINLRLEKMSFSANILGQILPCATVLEHLYFKDCTGMEHLSIGAPKLDWFVVVDCHKFDWLCFESNRNLTVVSIALCKEVENSEQGRTINLMKLLSNLPRIATLWLDGFSLKFLAAGSIPKWLPTSINTLIRLKLLTFGFNDLDHISCALCLLRNSPNLQYLEIKANTVANNYMVPVIINYLTAPDCLDKTLNQLQTVKLRHMQGLKAELLFIKLVLAHSPFLRRVIIKQNSKVDANEERRISRELMQFPRISAIAQIIYT